MFGWWPPCASWLSTMHTKFRETHSSTLSGMHLPNMTVVTCYLTKTFMYDRMSGLLVFIIFIICYRKKNVYWKWKTAIQLNNHFLSGNLGESKLNVNRLMKGFGELWRSWVQLELVLRNLTSRRSRIQSFSVS